MVYSPTGSGNQHVDQILTQIALGYNPGNMIGDMLFPQVPVKKQSDKYYVFGYETWSAHPDLRAPGTVANEIPGISLSTDTYYAQEHALQIPVTDEERKNVDSPLAPDRDGTELITQKVLLGREMAIHTMVTTAANFASGLSTTLSGTSQWSDYVNSDPITNIKTGIRAVHAKIFTTVNTAVMPYQVMTILEDHPDFIDRIKYSERAIITPEIIAAMLGIPNILVPGLGYNSAADGQTPVLGYLWGKDVLLAYVPPRAGYKIPAFGYEFVWETPYVDRWREVQRKSDIIRYQRAYDLKFIAVDGSADSIAGYLIKAAVA